ncbi:nuclease, putative [Syntrophotalea carbinolica DSM 2380]|uniref:Nuclease, putative n=1 Tax=Syntrophotalea carbinolica (strain DSM 2380 / NBRC 103641 / GraBd1) TaxID=338963 RepID=Q3A1T5_SYNC1|nr:thermonuclease family protein [Syntrophotalea carbinolica]ABA89672.1 nuclease, putative [Syntrophotalea carbinolica DSM 2380]
MKHSLRKAPGILLAALACVLLLAGYACAAPQQQGKVTWVYDGDTIKIAGIGKVRLLGIDVPEREGSPRDRYFTRQGISPATLRRVHAQARRLVRERSYGQTVSLRTGQPAHDRYGRLLAYVVLPDGRLLNRLLLERGLAVVYRRFDFTLKKDFLLAEKQARQAGRGMWED